jgi:hypothetical protein
MLCCSIFNPPRKKVEISVKRVEEEMRIYLYDKAITAASQAAKK